MYGSSNPTGLDNQDGLPDRTLIWILRNSPIRRAV